MGAGKMSRGDKIIREQITRDFKNKSRVYCKGRFYNGPNKSYVICDQCKCINWEANENDICNRLLILE